MRAGRRLLAIRTHDGHSASLLCMSPISFRRYSVSNEKKIEVTIGVWWKLLAIFCFTAKKGLWPNISAVNHQTPRMTSIFFSFYDREYSRNRAVTSMSDYNGRKEHTILWWRWNMKTSRVQLPTHSCEMHIIRKFLIPLPTELLSLWGAKAYFPLRTPTWSGL